MIEFVNGQPLSQSQNEYAAFVQDKWELNRRVTIDAGLRFDRDQLGGRNNFAPRIGLVFLPTSSGRTVVRGGVGLFYDKIPLNIGAFGQYPSQQVTTFDLNGLTVVDGPRLFRNTSPNELRNPYSLAWNLHEICRRCVGDSSPGYRP